MNARVIHAYHTFHASRAARSACIALLVFAAALAVTQPARAQWLPFDKLPNADRVRELERGGGRGAAGAAGRVSSVHWDLPEHKIWFEYAGGWRSVPIAGGEVAVEPGPPSEPAEPKSGYKEPRGARGTQAAAVPSPDGAWVAKYADGNITLEPKPAPDASPAPVKVTTEGSGKLKFGCADWVYAEELDQNTAMWWSPDSKRLAYYAFDERPVKDYFLVGGLTQTRTRSIVAGYPKPGEANSIAKLEIYDLDSKRRIPVDVGPDETQYVYGARWTPKGDGLLFLRTNRHQDTLDVMLANPATGQSRVVLTEKQATWQNNAPTLRFLSDGRRFIWETEANGFPNFQLWDLDKGKVADLTTDPWVCDQIVKIDEDAGWLYYTARSSETKINPQLHRVRLDGTGQERLTREDMHWSGFQISPDNSAFVAVKEFVDTPPQTALYGMDGEERAVLSKSAADYFAKRGLVPPEFLRIETADGTAELYGILFKPENFSSAKKYPLLLDVYGGPGINVVSSRFQPVDPHTAFGMLVAKVENRGTPGRGKEFESATFLGLGGKDVDDQAHAVKELIARGAVDPARVAVSGHSYGGYMTLMCLLRYPDVFSVGVAGAPASDWRQYDTIYTERYMRTPDENEKGYDAGSAIKLARNLRGKALLLHGMVDDNVHPANTFAIAEIWQRNSIPFEMMMFPTSAHGIASPAYESYKWSFLLKHLGLLPQHE